MPGPGGIITVNGNMEHSLRTEEHTMALAAEVYSGLIEPNSSPANKANNVSKRVRSVHNSNKSVNPDTD